MYPCSSARGSTSRFAVTAVHQAEGTLAIDTIFITFSLHNARTRITSRSHYTAASASAIREPPPVTWLFRRQMTQGSAYESLINGSLAIEMLGSRPWHRHCVTCMPFHSFLPLAGSISQHIQCMCSTGSCFHRAASLLCIYNDCSCSCSSIVIIATMNVSIVKGTRTIHYDQESSAWFAV
jgi:hypothetical protein